MDLVSVGLFVGLGVGLFVGLGVGLFVGLGVGLFVGLGVGLFVGLGVALSSLPFKIRAFTATKGRARKAHTRSPDESEDMRMVTGAASDQWLMIRP
eukprot:scaffold654418_cov51-Attheya_sp.AAC.1